MGLRDLIGPPAAPPVCASDAERHEVVDALREHGARGRLTLEEIEERTDLALSAQTDRELAALTADLPDLGRGEPVRRTRAVLREVSRGGRIRVPRRTAATALAGSVQLDLTQAALEGPEVAARARAVLGGVEIVVPEGTEVELTGRSLLGRRRSRVKGTARPGAPVVRVNATAVLGSVRTRSQRSGGRDLQLAGAVRAIVARRRPD